jgi:hypothetical protein
LYESALETVPRVFSDAAFFLYPALPTALNVSLFEILRGEGSTRSKQFDHSIGQQSPSRPGFINSRASQDVGTAGALADTCITIAGEERLASFSRFL